METLKIEKSNAIKAYETANQRGKSLLENLLGKNIFLKNVRDRFQTMDDIFEYHGTTQKEFDKKCQSSDLTEDEIGYRLEKLIVAAYNEGKLPDWSDGTWKCYPRFNHDTSSGGRFSFSDHGNWLADSYVGSRLVFHGPEAEANMRDAVKKFLPQYEKSRTT